MDFQRLFYINHEFENQTFDWVRLISFLFGEFDFVRLPNSIELNPRIEFDWVRLKFSSIGFDLLCRDLNEKKKQRSHMNDCFKHGKVLYADQPQLVKWSGYDALQTSFLYFWSLFCRTWRCTTSNTTVPIISILLTNKHVVFIYSVTIYHERKQRIVDGQGAPNINGSTVVYIPEWCMPDFINNLL